MKRCGGFLLGVVVGAGLMFGSLKYHFLRTKNGLQAIPKVTATFSDTYVDVRGFGATEWADHQELTAAVLKAGHSDLLESAAVNSLREGVGKLFGEDGER